MKAWFDQLEQEHDNLRTALSWCLEQAEKTGEPEAAGRAWRLCAALSDFWTGSLYLREGRSFQQRTLALLAEVNAAVQRKLLVSAAQLHLMFDEWEQAEVLAKEALVQARSGGDLQHTTEALLVLSFAAATRDQYAEARAALEEAAARHQQAGDALARAGCLQLLIILVLIPQGEFERAEELGEEAVATERTYSNQGTPSGWTLLHFGLALCVSQRGPERGAALVEQGLALLRKGGGANHGTGIALYHLGAIRRHQGRLVEAHALLEESLALGQGQWAPSERFMRQTELARVLTQQGQLAAAGALYQQNYALLPSGGGKALIATYLEGLAALQTSMGTPEAAARLWGAAEALREAIGAPMYPVDHAEYAPLIAAARAQLGETAFAAAWTEGRSMTPEQALASVD
jgi:tetratricopeptide (TPR) repeat protein